MNKSEKGKFHVKECPFSQWEEIMPLGQIGAFYLQYSYVFCLNVVTACCVM